MEIDRDTYDALFVKPSIFVEPSIVADPAKRLEQNDCILESMLDYKAMWLVERQRRLDSMGHIDVNFAEYSDHELDEARAEAKGWQAKRMASGIRAERQS